MTPTETLVSVEEYLSTSYQPDVNYIDGKLEERNVGTKTHGKQMRRIANLLEMIGLAAFLDTRLRLSPARYRVPDVCAYTEEPDEDIFTTPPLLCVEVLSPEDRLNRVAREAKEYLAFGVPIVWIVDPIDRLAYAVDRKSGLFQVSRSIATFDGAYSLKLADIFTDV